MSYTPNTDAAARARALPKAAVPQAARGPEIPESGYLVEEIGDGLFWLADGVFQMMFAVIRAHQPHRREYLHLRAGSACADGG
jgi:hypothetical protein